MKPIDPDILQALKAFPNAAEKQRVAKARERHRAMAEARTETQLELLSDELEQVIPRDHPMFMGVLLAVVCLKIEKQQTEPEFKSYLEEGLPQGY